MSLRKVIGNVFPFEQVFWSISRPPMADLVRVIQMPKQAMMVSLLSDSTCPTLKVSERPFLYLLILRHISFTRKVLVIFLALFIIALANMPHAHPEIEMPDPVTIADVREIAQKRLDPAAWDYYITGADDEQTVRRNETIFKK
jgi:hypothetical protein